MSTGFSPYQLPEEYAAIRTATRDVCDTGVAPPTAEADTVMP